MTLLANMVRSVKKHTTHFSEELRLKAEHLQEVKVAGTIKQIIPPVYSEDPTNLASSYVLNLDDAVGNTYVYVSPLMMNHFESLLQIGNMVLINGFANVISREIGGKYTKEVSVAAFEVAPFVIEEGLPS